MKIASFEAIVTVLNAAQVRYLVVGGLAVNAYGYIRFTKDVDIVIKLSSADIHACFSALAEIDYHPSVPITAGQFADDALREHWRAEKGMLVLKMWSDRHRETPLDIFVYEPFDFDAEYAASKLPANPSDPPVRFVSIPALIEMKLSAGRPQDLIDIEKLRIIQEITRK